MSDFRLALRSFAKSPGFTAVAVTIVALGIGAATAMFSTVNALVLRPVALPESDRLAVVYETNLPRNISVFSCTYPNYVDWRERSQSWESLAALNWRSMNLTGDGESELVTVRPMTANFLPTLGLAPSLGRGFRDDEDRPGRNFVAIVTHAFWQRRLGGQPEAIGRSLTLDGDNYTVVGVLGPGATFPGEIDVAIPMGAEPGTDRRMNHELEVYGRLKPGVTLAQADAEMKSIAAQIWSEYPAIDRGASTRIVPLARDIVGPAVRAGLFVLLGAVGLLLLIASANLSSLLLVRGSARAHELAIRTALGASRAQVVRQIITESLVVTLAGGALGVLLALWATESMHALPLPRAAEISVDLRVLVASLAATMLAGGFAGLGPAFQCSRARPQEALKSSGPRAGRRSRFRDALVVAQLAISLTLLVGATLLGRSFVRLLQVHPGFNAENVLTVSLRPGNNARAVSTYERVVERVAHLPAVSGVGLINILPLVNNNTSNPIFPVGPSVLPAGESIQASWRLVGGDYFGAMQIPLVRGRTLAGLSPEEARDAVVLSASFARMLFGDADPIGRQIDSLRIGGDRLTVIGVVGDVRSQRLGAEPAPTFYWSMHRFLFGPMHLVVRSGGDLAPLLASIRTAIKEIDPTVPVFRVRTLEELRATSLEQERFVLSLLGAFTAVALVLAALGTYGVVAYSVQQRTREIGIRLAVGAQAGDVRRLILGHGARLATLGVVLGLTVAIASARVLAAMLYATSTTDALSYALAALALVAATLLACWLPARRAARVDPLVALRAE